MIKFVKGMNTVVMKLKEIGDEKGTLPGVLIAVDYTGAEGKPKDKKEK